jgi:hypothetical protein
MKVTACLITWKRQHNLPKIIEHLSKYDFIDEIIIRDNSKCENIINYGRYTARAKNRYMYTQDDDCINHDLQALYDEFVSNPTRIVHGATEDYMRVIKENTYGESQMAMVGWGAFLDRRWIDLLDRYINEYGEDYCFYRETDRILSVLMKKHHLAILSNIEHLDNDKDALCSEKDHIKYKKLAIERALKLC